MKLRLSVTAALLLAVFFSQAQTKSLLVNPNIVLPKDSIISNALLTSIDNFLLAAQKPNEENKYVFESERIETFIQIDELKGIEKSGKLKDDNFYKPYLTNVVLLKDSNYLIQVSYIGTSEQTALLRASFQFIAHRANKTFTFSSILLRNTKNWKVQKIGNNVFHYQNSLNKDKIKEFNKLTVFLDAKLKVRNKIIDYYLCDNLIEMQQLVGVDYKSDYNGVRESVWGSSFGDRKLVVLGNNNSSFNKFDPHDVFHDRLSLVIPRNKVNKPVDEGCAYLYGGSWGFTWQEIFKAFKEQVASDTHINWLEIKETPVYFKTGNYSNQADYIVNALLVKKIEKEKGFEGVWELLNVGPFEKGNEKYYLTLEKLTGITKANYNDKIWELINSEK